MAETCVVSNAFIKVRKSQREYHLAFCVSPSVYSIPTLCNCESRGLSFQVSVSD